MLISAVVDVEQWKEYEAFTSFCDLHHYGEHAH